MSWVLVVEDDEDIREMIALVLEVGGCRVLTAPDGAEAMRLLQDTELPSLVLLDMMMPRLSGAEVLALIRHDPRLQRLPVVVISGDGRAGEIAKRAGATAFLQKPVDAGVLLDMAKRLAVQSASPQPSR